MPRLITVAAAQLGPIARSETRSLVVKRLLALLVDGVLDRPVADVAEIVTRDLFLGLGVRQG